MGRKKIRVGLLGCGNIAGAHARGFEAMKDRAEVVLVAEPAEARRAFIRDTFGPDTEIAGDYRDVLAREDIDAVDILLPHDMHCRTTVEAAEAGKHVLVEKVMARNVWECDRMIEACEAAGVTLTVAHDRRYNGEWEALKTIVDSGALGEVFFWKLDHNQDVKRPEGHWIRSRDRLGGGAIMSCLTHQIDGLRWYAGEVSEVTAMTHVIPERMEGETVGVILAGLASGALAELSINWYTRANRNGRDLWYEMVHACGTHGEAYRMTGRGTFVRLRESAPAKAVETYGARALEEFVNVEYENTPGHVGCIREWIRALRGEPADIRTGGRTCRGSVEVAEAAYRAAAQKRTVPLPIDPIPWQE